MNNSPLQFKSNNELRKYRSSDCERVVNFELACSRGRKIVSPSGNDPLSKSIGPSHQNKTGFPSFRKGNPASTSPPPLPSPTRRQTRQCPGTISPQPPIKILSFPIGNTGFIPFTYENGGNILKVMRRYSCVPDLILSSGRGFFVPQTPQSKGCKESCPDEFLDLLLFSRHPISPLFCSHRAIQSLPIRSSKLLFF